MREAPDLALALAPHRASLCGRFPGGGQVFFDVLDWLADLGAVWLLWRPAASAFFKPASALPSGAPTQISGP